MVVGDVVGHGLPLHHSGDLGDDIVQARQVLLDRHRFVFLGVERVNLLTVERFRDHLTGFLVSDDPACAVVGGGRLRCQWLQHAGLHSRLLAEQVFLGSVLIGPLRLRQVRLELARVELVAARARFIQGILHQPQVHGLDGAGRLAVGVHADLRERRRLPPAAGGHYFATTQLSAHLSATHGLQRRRLLGLLFGLAYLRNGVLQVVRFRLGRRCCRYGFRCRRQRYSRLCGLLLLRVSLALGLLDVVLHADWRRGLLLHRLVQGEAASTGG